MKKTKPIKIRSKPTSRDIFTMFVPELTRISPTPVLDLELILCFSLKMSREQLHTYPERRISVSALRKIRTLVHRRLKHEPIAYILGVKEFYGRNFSVNHSVLIPRPETETLVAEFLVSIKNTLKERKKILVADIGTGCGNIILSAVAELLNTDAFSAEKITWIGSDISSRALTVGRKNARRHHLSSSVSFKKGDLLSPFWSDISSYDTVFLLCNLPYLPVRLKKTVSREISHEPSHSLWSSHNGLGHYAKLLRQIQKLPKHLQLTIILEILPIQKKSLHHFVKSLVPYADISFRKHLDGKIRFAVLDISPQ